jgi:hypothetical protein
LGKYKPDMSSTWSYFELKKERLSKPAHGYLKDGRMTCIAHRFLYNTTQHKRLICFEKENPFVKHTFLLVDAFFSFFTSLFVRLKVY